MTDKGIFNWSLGQKTLREVVGKATGGGRMVERKENPIHNAEKVASFQSL